MHKLIFLHQVRSLPHQVHSLPHQINCLPHQALWFPTIPQMSQMVVQTSYLVHDAQHHPKQWYVFQHSVFPQSCTNQAYLTNPVSSHLLSQPNLDQKSPDKSCSQKAPVSSPANENIKRRSTSNHCGWQTLCQAGQSHNQEVDQELWTVTVTPKQMKDRKFKWNCTACCWLLDCTTILNRCYTYTLNACSWLFLIVPRCLTVAILVL